MALSLHKGWLRDVTHCPSPNFNARPPGTVVDALVVHNISLPPDEYGRPYIEQFFCNRLDRSLHPYFETIAGLEVSAHCLIKRDGALTQFVGFDDRAWHAGQSSLAGRSNCNDFSIGIELEGSDRTPYTQAQYRVLAETTKTLMAHYPITPERIVGHSDIAPGRKTDPGPVFSWAYFHSLLGA